MPVSVQPLTITLVALCLTAGEVAEAQIKFNLPVQPLAQALTSVGTLSHTNVVFDPSVVDGLQAPAFSGDMSAEGALSKLLQGTKLRVIRVDNNTLRVVAESAQKRSQSAGTAPPAGALVTQGGIHLASNESTARVDTSAGSDAVGTGSGSSDSSDSRAGLAEVVVSAQKRDERLQDVPISMAVLTGADLDRSSVQGITEALSAVPGIAVNEGWQGGGTQITIRGVTSSGPLVGGSNVVGYYLDSAPFGLVRSAVAPDSNAYDLGQVEVLRGPQGTLYGASALNGVVRILTNDADLNNFDLKARGLASATDGGGGNYRGDMAINVPLVAGVLAARAVVGYNDLSGWIDSTVARHVNTASERNYRLKINATPSDNLTVALSAWRTNDDYGAPSISNESGFNAAANPEPLSTTYDTYGMKIGYKAPGFNVSSMASYLDYKNTGDVDLVPFGAGNNILNTTLRSRVYSEELLLTSDMPGPWRWTAGAMYRNGKDHTYQPYTLLDLSMTVLLADFFDTSRSYAAYGELSRKFLEDRFEWTLGGRYFHDDVATQPNGQLPGQPFIPQTPTQASFSHTSPRAVLSWFPSRDITTYISYSQGFRSGIAQDELVTLVAPNFSAVKPDTLNNYEVGLKGNLLDHRLALDMSVYYIDWRDVQQVVNVPLGGGLVAAATVNGSGASGAGFDVGASVIPIDNLTLGASFSLNDLTQDRDVFSGGTLLFPKGSRLNYSPKYTAGVSAEYTQPVGPSGFHAHLSAAATYTARQNATALSGPDRLIGEGDAILVVRTSLALSSPGDHWAAKLYVDNLTNDRETPLAYPLIPAGYWDTRLRPRTYGLQLDYQFR